MRRRGGWGGVRGFATVSRRDMLARSGNIRPGARGALDLGIRRGHHRIHRDRLDLDLDVDASGEVELHELVHRLGGEVADVEEALVGANLEVLARVLVDVGGAEDAVNPATRREAHGAGNLGAGRLQGRAGRRGAREARREEVAARYESREALLGIRWGDLEAREASLSSYLDGGADLGAGVLDGGGVVRLELDADGGGSLSRGSGSLRWTRRGTK